MILITPRIIYGDKLIAHEGREVGTEPFLSYADYPALDIRNPADKPTIKRAPIVQ